MKAISIDDLSGDIQDLRQLLDMTYDELNECDFGTGGTRNHRLHRAVLLTRIALDMAQRMEGSLGGALPVDKGGAE